MSVSAEAGMGVNLEDGLLISAWATAAYSIKVRGRVILKNGTTYPFEKNIPVAADYAKHTEEFPLHCEGELVQLIVTTPDDVQFIDRGELYVQVKLFRGKPLKSSATSVLIADYVYDGNSPSWVAGGAPHIVSPVEGRGKIRCVTGTPPAAGQPYSYTLPTGIRWKLLALDSDLVCGAGVANRIPHLILDDGTVNIYDMYGSLTITASQTGHFYGMIGSYRGTPYATGIVDYIPLPHDLYLEAGFRIRLVSVAMQAADQWLPYYVVEEWLVCDDA